MSPTSLRAPVRAAARTLAAVLALVCALALTPAFPGVARADDHDGVQRDPAVREARERVERLEETRALVAARLDAAARAYEHANAHRVRLEDEADDVSSSVPVAVGRVQAAEESFARSVQAVYRHPYQDAAAVTAVVGSPDTSTALHRVALLQRMPSSERVRANRLQVAAERVTGDVRQHEIVQAGARAAEDDAGSLADELETLVAQAARALEDAQEGLSAAEEEAARRLAEERRQRQAAERAAQLAAAGSGPLPPVDGKVCPIGSPNAFIDSWGFPRSGGRVHRGVDMFAEYGMPLYAVGDGVIRRVWNNRLGGLSIDLLDEDGHRYYYAHLSETFVQGGQRVRAGDVIGANGNSGNARGTPPHLHWQYHPNDGPPVNPYPLAHLLCRS